VIPEYVKTASALPQPVTVQPVEAFPAAAVLAFASKTPTQQASVDKIRLVRRTRTVHPTMIVLKDNYVPLTPAVGETFVSTHVVEISYVEATFSVAT
jgi:hypothetical protein